MTNENTTGAIKIQSHLEMRKPIRLKSLSQKDLMNQNTPRTP
jgi:hypothetical protein